MASYESHKSANGRRQSKNRVRIKDGRIQSISPATSAGGGGGVLGDPSPFRDVIKEIVPLKSLPREDEASDILRRIVSEFGPILRNRGWSVLRIFEMCCCGDYGKINSKSGKNRRLMGNNVAGYNTPRMDGRSSSGIHLRLRRPRSHELIPYEEVAGVMCHEIAHNVHGSHSFEFYELMADIEEEWSRYAIREKHLVNKTGKNKSDRAVSYFHGKGHALGGRPGNNAATSAAERRKQHLMGCGSSCATEEYKTRPMRELTLRAALSRSKTSYDTNNDRKVITRRSKPTPATASDWKGAATVRGVVVCIECSDDSDNDQVEAWVGSRKSADRRKSAKVVSGRGIVHSSPHRSSDDCRTERQRNDRRRTRPTTTAGKKDHVIEMLDSDDSD